MVEFPTALYVSDNSVEEYLAETAEEIDRDPRGLLLMFHPPEPTAKYVMGMDSAEGITGWTRGTRTKGDHKTDNGAIEVFKVDGVKELVWKEEDGKKIPDIDPATKEQRILYRDLQVAEWAGPCDAVEIARYANVIGRIYKGDAEDQCELIWESWPGSGLLTTQELLRLDYGNLWHWEYIDSVAEETNRLGWRSTRESQKILWYRARRHLMNRKAVIRSKHLLAEYSNAEIDMEKMRARAAYGYHDDRFQAANMCFWCGHKWTYNEDSSHEDVRTTPLPVDFQRYAPGLDELGNRTGPTYQEWKSTYCDDWE